MTLNVYGLWCLSAFGLAFGTGFVVFFVVRIMGDLGGLAIGLPEDNDD